MSYHDSLDLQNELHRIMGEISAEFTLLGDDAYCVAARRYIVNHWFRVRAVRRDQTVSAGAGRRHHHTWSISGHVGTCCCLG